MGPGGLCQHHPAGMPTLTLAIVSFTTTTWQVFARPLSHSKVAVVLFNRGEDPQNMTATWSQLGLSPSANMTVRDVLAHTDNGTSTGPWNSLVQPHGVVFIVLTPVKVAPVETLSHTSRRRMPASPGIVDVFTQDEVKQCGDIRIPQMTVTPSGVLLAAQCRNANSSSNAGQLGDNMIHAKVVTKFSRTHGTTWEPMRVLTPVAFSHGQVVYDAVRNHTLLQYQHHPNTDPTLNSSLFQRVSHDDGTTWGAATALNEQVKRCNPKAPKEMQVGSAGSHIQTSSGRIIYVGHANGVACRWWTDDGGATYNSSDPYVGNEASVAEIIPGSVYMNARGLTYAWKGNRTSYWSSDDGSTFSEPVSCPVKEDEGFGCSAGLVADLIPPKALSGKQPARLFLSEPAGPGRKGLVVHCSLDEGHTWPHSLRVDGDTPAAYSAIRVVETAPGKHSVLVVWEAKPTMKATLIATAWCRG